MTKLYNDFRQILLPFGEIFNYIITKKINLPKDVKNKILKLRKSFIINITKKSNKIKINNYISNVIYYFIFISY